jgi:nucleotide-binding universal stress UspA family protein
MFAVMFGAVGGSPPLSWSVPESASKKSDSPVTKIVKYATAEHIDLIVMGTHGRKGVAHFFIGRVTE